MARSPSHPFDALLEYAANVLASRLSGVVTRATGRSSNGRSLDSANERRRAAMTGRKLDMSCRVPDCKNRSGGPRHGYMCEQHRKLPKKEQQAARDAWKATHEG